MHNIVILGSGFAAVAAVRELRKLSLNAEITVVSPDNELVYLPSLIWLPSGKRKGSDLRVSLGNFFQRHHIRWHQGSVISVEDSDRKVITDNGELTYDYLIIATGGRYLRKLPGIEHAFIPCEGIEPCEAISERINNMDGGTIAIGFASNPKEPGAVRGGPMFEFLFGIDTLLRQQKRRDKFKLIFFNPQLKPGKRLGEGAVERLLAQMHKQGIETQLGHKPVRFEENKVVTEGAEFDADLILFMSGLTGPEWLDNTDLPRSEGGFIAADEFCRAKGMERVYVAGDIGSYPGPEWMAKQAHQADLQAVAVAKNIAADINGIDTLSPFTTELACIIDSLDSGMLVYRRGKRKLVLPRFRALHWAKSYFEKMYISKLR